MCVITGANSGIGFETAKALSALGAYIVMVCRNEEKAESARRAIISTSGNAGIDIVLCDFSIQSEIRKAAGHISEAYSKIDVLINNHGFVASGWEETVDGYEMTFAVNHLGYFLFTQLLLDNIKAAGKARIINVASRAHRRGFFDAEDIQMKNSYSPWIAYSNSKLYNILFTRELARRLVDTNVTANCLHPGVIASNFAKSGQGITKLFFKFAKPFLTTPEQGAKTSVYLASSPEVENVNGAYFVNGKPATPFPQALDDEAAKILWEISERMVK